MGPELVSITEIHANPDQPRKIFKEKELHELANSIKENGLIQPLIVSKDENGGFMLIAGERRLRASKIAGVESVPVVIKHATTQDQKVMAIIENIQRTDLNCVEISLAYFDLMSSFSLTQDSLAKKLGVERSSVANYLRLLKLPREVVNMLRKEEISFGHGKILASVKNDEESFRLAKEAAAENLSVRELEKRMKKKPVDIKPKKKGLYNDQLDDLRGKLEKTTGFHFQLKTKSNGSGQVTIKFNNEAEFNEVYAYLLKK
jgi:ParB family chromosome partitioning protein